MNEPTTQQLGPGEWAPGGGRPQWGRASAGSALWINKKSKLSNGFARRIVFTAHCPEMSFCRSSSADTPYEVAKTVVMVYTLASRHDMRLLCNNVAIAWKKLPGKKSNLACMP